MKDLPIVEVVGHPLSKSGYGNTARFVIDLLYSNNIPYRISNLRPFYEVDLPKKWLDGQIKSDRRSDIFIFVHSPSFKNFLSEKRIDLFFIESTDISPSWIEHIKENKLILSATQWQKNIIKKHLPEKEVKILNIEESFMCDDNINIHKNNNELIFYSILALYNPFFERKNYSDLLIISKEIEKEFNYVKLILKVDTFEKGCYDRFLNFYNSMNLKNTKLILNEDFTDEEIIQLHKTSHCFILLGWGEGWGLPHHTALKLGNIVITSKSLGFWYDYPDNTFNNLFLVNGDWQDIPKHEFTGWFNGQWFIPDIVDAYNKVRNVILNYKNLLKEPNIENYINKKKCSEQILNAIL